MPPSVHLAITASNSHAWKDFVRDVNEAIADMKENPKLNKAGDAALYGKADFFPDRKLVEPILLYYQDALLECL
jgi:hypothetical protein